MVIFHDSGSDSIGGNHKVLVEILCNRNKGLKIINFNARSLRGDKLDYTKYVFENSNVDVICVTETWFLEGVDDSVYNLMNYRLLRNDRMGRRGGGVAVYCRKHLNMQLVGKSIDSDVEYINVCISDNSTKLLISCVYRPHLRLSLNSFVSELSATLIDYDHYVICGDFNTNLLVKDSNSDLLLDQMLEMGFNAVNTTIPTRFGRNTKNSLLDIMFVSDLDQVCKFDQFDFVSDHDLIFCAFKFKFTQRNILPTSISYRDLKLIDEGLLFSALESVPWNNCWGLSSVDDKLELLTNNVVNIFECFVPLRTVNIKNPSCPWFNSFVITAIKKRNKLYSIWKKYKTNVNWELYKKARNHATVVVRNSKRRYFGNKLSSSSTAKGLWRNLRSLGVWNGDAEKCDFPPDVMNNFFSSNASAHCIGGDTSACGVFDRPCVEECFSFHCVDDVVVYNAIMKIKSNAMGVDGLSIKFIKLILPYILSTLTHVINHCITTSCFPRIWKEAIVLPLAKKNIAMVPGDFRPISILPALSKVMELIMSEQIKKHVYGRDLVSRHQSGYRSGHSCTTAILKVLDDIRVPYDNDDITLLCLLDFSKAFDSVNYWLLCNKLRYYFGFRSDAVNLIRSYLSDRSQRVKVGEEYSGLNYLCSGVPQGSLLGPLLFSLFINDIFEVTKYVSLHAYADDIQMYLSDRIGLVEDLFTRLNDDLSAISLWAKGNLLQLNPSKSVLLPITTIKTLFAAFPSQYINNLPIAMVNKTRNLGFVINSSLTCKDHIIGVVSKVFFILRRLRMSTDY